MSSPPQSKPEAVTPKPEAVSSSPPQSKPEAVTPKPEAVSSSPPQSKPAAVTPTQNKPAAVTPTQNKPAAVTPTQNKPAAVTPTQNKPAAVTPTQNKPAAVTPTQNKPAAVTPTQNKPAATTKAAQTGPLTKDMRAVDVAKAIDGGNASAVGLEVRWYQSAADRQNGDYSTAYYLGEGPKLGDSRSPQEDWCGYILHGASGKVHRQYERYKVVERQLPREAVEP